MNNASPLREDLGLADYSLALEALGLVPVRAMLDPARSVTVAMTCGMEALETFMRIVTKASAFAPLDTWPSEDAARLHVAAVLALLLLRMRALRRSREIDPVRILPSA